MQNFGLTGLMLAIVFILYVVVKSLSGFSFAQTIAFVWGLAGGSAFLASFMFGYFSSNASGSSYLTLPVSNFEKWLCGVLIAGIFYPVIFLIFYHIIDTSFVAIYHNSLDTSAPFYKQQYDAVYPFDLNGGIAWKVYPMFLFYTGAMLIGSLYFNKTAFIKVAIVLCVGFIIVMGLNWIFAKMLFGNVNDAQPFHHVAIPVGKEEGTIELPARVQTIFNYILFYIFPGSLWVLAYTRLREKEF